MGLFDFMTSKKEAASVEVSQATKNHIKKVINPYRHFKGDREKFYLATTDRLTEDFMGSSASINVKLKSSLISMRKKARQLSEDNDFVKKFLGMVVNNVIGECGIKLQAKVVKEDGSRDRADQASLERAFRDWGRKSNCAINKSDTWLDAQKLAARCLARDGEIFIRRRISKTFKYGIKIEVIEADRVDETYNANKVEGMPGNQIIMGIEFDSNKAPIAYHIRRENPGDLGINTTYFRDRVPADQIIHLFAKEYPNQARGYTWLHTCGKRFNMLGGYEEAELVAARTGASKMGFFSGAGESKFDGDEEDAEGNKVTVVNPGTFEDIGDKTFTSFDPQHPTTAYGNFVKWVLRGAASGLEVSYNALSNDLEGVNFSSIRTATLAEREAWKVLQSLFIEHMHDIVYEWFLEYALLKSAIKGPTGFALPATKFDKFRDVNWQGRRWQWVDPVKDAQTNNLEESAGHTSKTRILAEKGIDFEEIILDKVAEAQLLQDVESEYGIKISFDMGTGSTSSDTNADNQEETQDDEDEENTDA